MGRREYSIVINYPKLHDKKWLRKRYVVEDSGFKAIADEVGCSIAAVIRALGLAGIDIKGGHGPRRVWEPTRDQLIAEYEDAGSLPELARRRGLSKATIRNVFGRHHMRPSDVDITFPLFRRYPQLGDKEWLARELYKKRSREVAEEVGCSTENVLQAAGRHGIEPPGRGRAVPHEVKDRAVRLYLAGNNMRVVARVMRVDQSAVWRWLRQAGVDTTLRARRPRK